jgi:hypothetical protein
MGITPPEGRARAYDTAARTPYTHTCTHTHKCEEESVCMYVCVCVRVCVCAHECVQDTRHKGEISRRVTALNQQHLRIPRLTVASRRGIKAWQ